VDILLTPIDATTGEPTGEALVLPESLEWADEDWSPWGQVMETGLTGSPLVQVAARGGRPITLQTRTEGNVYYGGIYGPTRSALLALDALNPLMRLTLADGRELRVIFRREQQGAMTTSRILREADCWTLVLRLMEA